MFFHSLTLGATIKDMKETRTFFEKSIVKQSSYSTGKKTVQNISENLIDGITKDLFEDDFAKGSGNELNAKFLAIYSSSALAANNFSIIKKNPFSFQFLDKSEFQKCNFERQFTTGLGGIPPNIDFVLESSTDVIAFESKYLEHLVKKPASFALAYNKNRLPFLSEFWFNLINIYSGELLNLDVAQLIKHAIGLIKYNCSLGIRKEITLVYIYWVPKNIELFDTFKHHLDQLLKFQNILNTQNDIKFKAMKYDEFWKMYENTELLKEHFSKVRNRYYIEI